MKPLKHKLRLLDSWANPAVWHESLAIHDTPLREEADDFDRAHEILSRCTKKGLLALSYYYSDAPSFAKQGATDFLLEARAFFFGEWRDRLNHPDGANEAFRWKRRFEWMGVFELVLLWGSSLNDWASLAEIGRFPEPDSYIDFSHKSSDRDLLLAIAAFAAGADRSIVLDALVCAAANRDRKCRLAAATLNAIVVGDSAAFQKALAQFLRHHEEKEFLKKDMLCRISVLGTFFYHAGRKAGMEADSALHCIDYVVRLDKS